MERIGFTPMLVAKIAAGVMAAKGKRFFFMCDEAKRRYIEGILTMRKLPCNAQYVDQILAALETVDHCVCASIW